VARAARAEFETEVFYDRSKHERRFLQGEGGSDAFARTGAERKIGEPINRRAINSEKAARIKHIGPMPQQAMPVQDARRHDDQ
jgi:hypothetical protein